MASNYSAEKVLYHGPDVISLLPDSLLAEILSRLPADEVLRTSILSKRWYGVWRYVSRFDFDPKRMMKPSKQMLCQQQILSPALRLIDVKKAIFHAVMMINKVLFSHKSDLISCKIIHFPDSCKYGQLEKWIRYLISDKKVQQLSLTCEDYPGARANEFNIMSLPTGIFSCASLHALELIGYQIENHEPFNHCHNLKTLKLKWCELSTETLDGIISGCAYLEHMSLCYCSEFDRVRVVSDKVKTVELQCLKVDEVYLSTQALEVLVLDSLKCVAKNLVIDAPMLREFRAYDTKRIVANNDKPLKAAEILEHCSAVLRPGSDHSKGNSNLFGNLSTLSIDLDLNNIRRVLILAFILRVCTNLKQLEINIQSKRKEAKRSGQDGTQTSLLPYPASMLWEKRELCDCISRSLTRVTIKGFQGKEREMEFVTHLITKGCVMERMEIWCSDRCSRQGAEATLSLLSLPRSSIDVSIALKPCPIFQSFQVNASFQTWLLTLN